MISQKEIEAFDELKTLVDAGIASPDELERFIAESDRLRALGIDTKRIAGSPVRRLS